MKLSRLALVAILLATPLQEAFGADWQLVLSDRNRRVEIDRASIYTSDRGTKVSWGRVVLTKTEATSAGYATIKALNRYDCQNRTFVTLKRAYLDASENIVREETVSSDAPVRVTPGSVDERMWREVCNPPSINDLQKLADELQKLSAAKPAAATSQKPAAAKPPPVAKASPPAPRAAAPSAAQAMQPATDKAPSSPARTTDAGVRTVGTAAPPPPEPPAAIVLADAREEAPAAPAPPVQAARPTRHAPDAGWRYEGEKGPSAWGRLRKDWRLCSEGKRQSPIDLRDGLVVDLAPVRFDYRASGFRIRDTGNTLEVTVAEGMGMEVRGVHYELERFTLHRPSQERIGGMAYDMTMYLEHRSADGRIAMLSILLTAEGEPNTLLQTLWNNLPLDRGREFVPDATIDLAAFMPTDPGHYLYSGSLPMPPCTEDVTWVVMKTPVVISQDQVALFARLYPRNTRPIQRTNGRLILESR